MADGALLCLKCGFDVQAGASLWPVAGEGPYELSEPEAPPTLPAAAFSVPQQPVVMMAMDQFVDKCLSAWRYGTSNFRASFKLTTCWTVWIIVTAIMFAVLNSPMGMMMFGGDIMNVVFMTIPGVAALVLSGFSLRFYLDTVIGSLEGLDEAPDCPSLQVREFFRLGVWGLIIACVYVLPIVTLPLLPLGLLAFTVTDDARCCDVFWALRAARRHTKWLGMLWMMLLMWGVGGGVVVVAGGWIVAVCGLALYAGCLGILLAALVFAAGASIVMATQVTVYCMQFRCVGMLGRYCPDVIESLPAVHKPLRSTAIIAVLAGLSLTGWAALCGDGVLDMMRISWFDSSSDADGGGGGMPIDIAGAELPTVMAQNNLRVIHMTLLGYARDHVGRFPPELADLRDLPGHALFSVSDPSVPLVYIAGQRQGCPRGNVLVYDPVPIEGRCAVLTVGGDLLMLSWPAELKPRLASQKNEPAP